jgi:cupin 2 domain-containing protein
VVAAVTCENLFADAGPLSEELVRVLLSVPGQLRIERIVSRGHCSPHGFWYDQDEHEWVSVLAGRAQIEIEARGLVELGPGDHLLLPAHVRHRVVHTDPEVDTIWLTVFYKTP